MSQSDPAAVYGYGMHDARIDALLARVSDHDGSPALSDAKLAELGDEKRKIVIEEDGAVVAVGIAASHRQPDGTDHLALETVLDPGLRFAEFEDRLLASTLTLVPRSHAASVWSRRHSLDAALDRAGFGVVRELAQMAIGLPVAGCRPVFVTRPFEAADADAIVELNRAVFASHREAASLDSSDIARTMGLEGFDADGFLILEEHQEVVGFCWTRVHANGDGEIYRIAVAPRRQGGGLGRSLAVAGFDHLAGHPDVLRGVLWVDSANQQAISLYESIGMTHVSLNREFERLIRD